MVCRGFDPERIRSIVRNAATIFRRHGCHFDITLKDVETVEGEPERLPAFVRIAREAVEDT
jgi:uncharacterized protein (DUF1330 family)